MSEPVPADVLQHLRQAAEDDQQTDNVTKIRPQTLLAMIDEIEQVRLLALRLSDLSERSRQTMASLDRALNHYAEQLAQDDRPRGQNV